MHGFQQLLKRHYAYAAPTLCLSTLGASDLALFVMAMAAALVLMPCAFGDQVDEIARATRQRQD